MIQIQRVYEFESTGGLACFLVDRLYPRGIKKETLGQVVWLKEVGPSTELRKWFGHDPAKWEEFQRRYFAELEANPQSWLPLVEAARQGDILLLYGARNRQYNHAVALRRFLEART